MPTNESKTSTTPPHKTTGPHKESHDGRRSVTRGDHAYVVPVVHVSLPESAVNVGFWSILMGSVVLGAVDLPLAVLIGAGVLIARHHSD